MLWAKRVVIFGLAAMSPSFAIAGEFDCMLNCDIDGFGSSLEWRSTGCNKPSPPILSVYGYDDYNASVDAFNSYVGDVNSYLACVKQEAASDIKRLPDIVVDGVRKQQNDVMSDVDSARSQLEMLRPAR